MKIFDMHIHARNVAANPEKLLLELSLAGIHGACVFSNEPKEYSAINGTDFDTRLAELDAWTKGYEERLFPVLWVHPYEDGITEKVHQAAERGVCAFKIICNNFYVYEDKSMALVSEIAKLRKPVIFHTGILWDGEVSSNYNRPLNWECMLDIENLKFSMGHCSWPWHDECIALYGKFLNSKSNGKSAEMFFDLTPGTPEIYREELFRKLLTIGYHVPNNIMFGTDCHADAYNVEWAKRWLSIDGELLDKFKATKLLKEKIYSQNLFRFLGKSGESTAEFKLNQDEQEMWRPELEI